MANNIYFQDTYQGPIQVDEINESQMVRFCCNVEFSIIFKSDSASDCLDFNSKEEMDERADGPLVEFNSHFDEKEHVIKLKFKNLPQGGQDYTVKTERGELDPRVVPPKK